MAKYKISGIWKDSNETITHYALHEIRENDTTLGVKTLKADAVKILSQPGNEAVTWMWNYTTSNWQNGAKVEVVSNSFLRTVHDNKVVDNLAHLIDYDWLAR
jgi:hypothetical protein